MLSLSYILLHAVLLNTGFDGLYFRYLKSLTHCNVNLFSPWHGSSFESSSNLNMVFYFEVKPERTWSLFGCSVWKKFTVIFTVIYPKPGMLNSVSSQASALQLFIPVDYVQWLINPYGQRRQLPLERAAKCEPKRTTEDHVTLTYT